MMPAELVVALRLLREGRSQTLLIFSGAALGVAVVLFLTALLAGLEASLVDRTLSTQAHVVIEGRRDVPSTVRPDDGVVLSRHVDPGFVRPVLLRDVEPLVRRLDARPDVRAASPVAATSAFAMRGGLREPILLQGVESERHELVVRFEERLVDGRVDLTGDQALIGAGLAESLGVGVGDTLRVVGPVGADGVFRVVGVARFGVAAADDAWVFVSVRRAQSLGGLGDNTTRVDVLLREPGLAGAVAASLRRDVDADVSSWQERNPELLSAIRAQASSGIVINAFVALAVALGIASVLVVSVVQRRGEIGVLRATGTRRSTVMRIFLWQGALVGLVGSVVGVALGAVLVQVFVQVVRDETGAPLFAVTVTPQQALAASLLATVTGLLAAWVPARSASRLNPVDAIKGGS